MDEALKTRGVRHLKIDTRLLFVPLLKFLATHLSIDMFANICWKQLFKYFTCNFTFIKHLTTVKYWGDLYRN